MLLKEVTRTTYTTPSYISLICRMGLCTELFYAIIPTLFLCFLLICYPYILLHLMFFFILVYKSCPIEELYSLYITMSMTSSTEKISCFPEYVCGSFIILFSGVGHTLRRPNHAISVSGTLKAFHCVFWCQSYVHLCIFCSVSTSDQWVSNNCPRHLLPEHPTPDYLWPYQVGCHVNRVEINFPISGRFVC